VSFDGDLILIAFGIILILFGFYRVLTTGIIIVIMPYFAFAGLIGSSAFSSALKELAHDERVECSDVAAGAGSADTASNC